MKVEYSSVRDALGRLDAIGYTPPAKVSQIVAAIDAMVTPKEDRARARRALETATAQGDSEAMRAAADILSLPADLRVTNDVYAHAHNAAAAEIRSLILPTAWKHAHNHFDDAGRRLMKAVAAVDADTPAEEIMRKGTRQQREAWADLPEIADELDSAAGLLGLLFRDLHAGSHGHVNMSDPHVWLGLVVKPGKAHPRRLLETWAPDQRQPDMLAAFTRSRKPRRVRQTHQNRGGRWAAVAKIGALIEAVADPNDWTRFEVPPLYRDGNRVLDPCDGPEVAAEIERLSNKRKRTREQNTHMPSSSPELVEMLTPELSVHEDTDVEVPSEVGVDSFRRGLGLDK